MTDDSPTDMTELPNPIDKKAGTMWPAILMIGDGTKVEEMTYLDYDESLIEHLQPWSWMSLTQRKKLHDWLSTLVKVGVKPFRFKTSTDSDTYTVVPVGLLRATSITVVDLPIHTFGEVSPAETSRPAKLPIPDSPEATSPEVSPTSVEVLLEATSPEATSREATSPEAISPSSPLLQFPLEED